MDVTSVLTWWRSTQMVKQTSGPLKPNAGFADDSIDWRQGSRRAAGFLWCAPDCWSHSCSVWVRWGTQEDSCNSKQFESLKKHVSTKMAVFGRALQIQILILILLKDNRSKLYKMLKRYEMKASAGCDRYGGYHTSMQPHRHTFPPAGLSPFISSQHKRVTNHCVVCVKQQ